MPVLSTFLDGSTRFLLTRGSPSALSTACRLDAVGGPKYAASSFGFFLACGRDLEPEATAPDTEPLTDMVTGGCGERDGSGGKINKVSFVHEEDSMTPIPTRSCSHPRSTLSTSKRHQTDQGSLPSHSRSPDPSSAQYRDCL